MKLHPLSRHNKSAFLCVPLTISSSPNDTCAQLEPTVATSMPGAEADYQTMRKISPMSREGNQGIRISNSDRPNDWFWEGDFVELIRSTIALDFVPLDPIMMKRRMVVSFNRLSRL